MERGRLAAGESILIHGGASGVGTSAIQLARAFGARVFVTAGNAEKCEACRKLGADVAINYKTEDFVEVVKRRHRGHGVDVILDMVGGDYVNRNYEAAAEEARIVQIAVQKGARAEVDIRRLMVEAALAHRLDAPSPLGRVQGARSPPRFTRRSGRSSRRARSPR